MNIKSSFLKYVSFNVAGMIGLSCYILADTFFVAQGVGAAGLAALNLAIPIYSFINGIGLMIGMGGATRFAISKSEGVFTQALYFAGFGAIIFLIAGIFFPAPLAHALGAEADTALNTATYLRIILTFAPMFLLNNIVICFVRNDGHPKLSMAAMLAGSFSNIILDYIFIFPCKMGMFGAALATGIAPIVSLGVLSGYFIKRKNTFHLASGRPKVGMQMDIASLGIASLITEFSSGIVIIIFNGAILQLEGTKGVAAYGIIANIALVIIAVFTGISQGMQPIISKCHREKNTDDGKKILKYGIFTAVTTAIVVYVAAVIFRNPIVGAFNRDGDPELAKIAVKGLLIYFTAFTFTGINIICATYFSALDSPKNAFILSLLRGFAVIVPAVFILSALFGINGIWCSVPLTEFAVFLVALKMLAPKKGKLNR